MAPVYMAFVLKCKNRVGENPRYHLRIPGSNGQDNVPLVHIYGPKIKYERGASVAFNLRDRKKGLINPEVVLRLAEANMISLGVGIEATSKTIMRTMGVKGLTLYHLKSHLLKYRLGKQSCKEFTENSKDASCIAESQDTGSSTTSSTRMMPQDSNDGFQVTEALRVQMEVQRRLHEQLEVPRRLQLRIEAQGKYLQSILEKACKALNDQAVATAGLDAAREELSELAITVANDCPPSVLPIPSLPDFTAYLENGIAPSIDSCLTSNSNPVSPMGFKKRHRAMFSNGGDSLPHAEWMMSG